MKKTYKKTVLVMGIFFLLLEASATLSGSTPVWTDNFDTYTNGQFLDGGADDGGWKGWDNVPASGAYVTNTQPYSTPHSVDILLTTDLVHEYEGYTTGQWVYRCMQYIPTNYTGNTYFILLSNYTDGGGNNNKWAVLIRFDSANQIVESESDLVTTPLITGEWVELRTEIDLDSDWFEFYYGDTLLIEKEWTACYNNAGDGYLVIDAVDLFANGASSVYYDDLSLLPAGNELICDAGGPYNGEVDVPIQFTGFASGGVEPYTWAWEFGDGDTADVQNPTHAYDTAGTYTATLTVTDATSAVVTDDATVTIVAPQPTLEIGTVTGGFGLKASVKNTGAGAATNVDWTITLDGKLVFLGKSSTGTIATLAASGEEPIKAKFIFGIGNTNIKISATCDEGKTAEVTKTALVLGPFVLKVA
ncbi:MAG: PKD domain-containing protein [Candidatus Thermoplasmatota archaeon]